MKPSLIPAAFIDWRHEELKNNEETFFGLKALGTLCVFSLTRLLSNVYNLVCVIEG